MRHVPARQHRGRRGRRLRPTRPTSTAKPTMRAEPSTASIGRRRLRSARSSRTPSGSTTCMATCGSGWRIATRTRTQGLQMRAVPGFGAASAASPPSTSDFLDSMTHAQLGALRQYSRRMEADQHFCKSSFPSRLLLSRQHLRMHRAGLLR